MKSIAEIFDSLPPSHVNMLCKAPIICNDGFTMSVQASEFHYCAPRENTGPYHQFEVGFPSKREPLLMEYAENKRSPRNTVYGWVPASVIDKVIAAHGGLKED